MALRHKLLLLAVIALPVLLLASTASVATQPAYMGPEACKSCHPAQYDKWASSGHSSMLLPAEKAMERGFPLPAGITWDDVAYTLGGIWKIRYIDKSGYIITWHFEDGVKVPGGNQWNIETKRWVNYHAGEEKKYDCGHCHTTGYNPEGVIEGMPGIVGSWVFPGITCESCHGPGGGTDKVAGPHGGTGTPEAALEDPIICGWCHIRTSKSNVLAVQQYTKLADVPSDLLKVMTDIDAKGGLIRHHEQFEEWYNSPHREAGVTCQTCHDPHSGEVITECSDCHTAQYEVVKEGLMWQSGVRCTDCHMAKTVKSAEGRPDVYYGDVPSHVFVINTSPDATLTYKEPGTGKEYGNPYIPLGWACASPGCHGVKGIVEGTASPLLPKGWDTTKAAEIVAEIQNEVESKLDELRNLISEAEGAISNAEGRGVEAADLATAKRLLEEAKALVNKIEADETYGVHNPDLIEELEVAIGNVKTASEIAGASKPPVEIPEVPYEDINKALTDASKALADAGTALTTGYVGITLAVVALLIGVVAFARKARS